MKPTLLLALFAFFTNSAFSEESRDKPLQFVAVANIKTHARVMTPVGAQHRHVALKSHLIFQELQSGLFQLSQCYAHMKGGSTHIHPMDSTNKQEIKKQWQVDFEAVEPPSPRFKRLSIPYLGFSLDKSPPEKVGERQPLVFHIRTKAFGQTLNTDVPATIFGAMKLDILVVENKVMGTLDILDSQVRVLRNPGGIRSITINVKEEGHFFVGQRAEVEGCQDPVAIKLFENLDKKDTTSILVQPTTTSLDSHHRCIAPENNRQKSPINLANCQSSQAQWRLEPGGRHLQYSLRNIASNQCIDVYRHQTNDSPINQWGCNQSNNQRIYLNPTPQGGMNLILAHSNKCLAIQNNQLWQTNCAPDQITQNWNL